MLGTTLALLPKTLQRADKSINMMWWWRIEAAGIANSCTHIRIVAYICYTVLYEHGMYTRAHGIALQCGHIEDVVVDDSCRGQKLGQRWGNAV